MIQVMNQKKNPFLFEHPKKIFGHPIIIILSSLAKKLESESGLESDSKDPCIQCFSEC